MVGCDKETQTALTASGKHAARILDPDLVSEIGRKLVENRDD